MSEDRPPLRPGLVPFDLLPPSRILVPRFGSSRLASPEERERRRAEEEARAAAELASKRAVDGHCHVMGSFAVGWEGELDVECELPYPHEGQKHRQTTVTEWE